MYIRSISSAERGYSCRCRESSFLYSVMRLYPALSAMIPNKSTWSFPRGLKKSIQGEVRYFSVGFIVWFLFIIYPISLILRCYVNSRDSYLAKLLCERKRNGNGYI